MTREQRTWRDHFPPAVELVGSSLELTVGEEFAKARARLYAARSAERRSSRQAECYQRKKRAR